MVIDTFPQYRLWKSSLLRYLQQQFPLRVNEIEVKVSRNDKAFVGRTDNAVGTRHCLSPQDPREVDPGTDTAPNPFLVLIDTSVYQAQRNYILKYVCYRPESDDD